MRALLTRDEARSMDRDAVERLGLPSLVLMENAGRGAAEAILEHFPDRLRHVVCIGGAGQNGGDAWVVARHLANAGVRTTSFLVGASVDEVKGDARINLDALRRSGLVFAEVRDAAFSTLRAKLGHCTLVVDGLFGTGLSRELGGVHADAVRAIVESQATVVALDLPSGIDSDTGAVLGRAVRAQLTVTFGGAKRGLHAFPGAEHAGKVVVASIGVPEPERAGAFLLEAEDVASAFPRRPNDAHKGTNGHVLVVGGAPGTTGAAILAGRAALRAGAGLVTLAVPPEARASVEPRVLELMTLAWPSGGQGFASALEGKRSVVLGPGMGLGEDAAAVFRELALEAPMPVVIDADGLHLLARAGLESLRHARGPRILTPHPREAARLLGCETAEVQENRFDAARRLSDAASALVVLKGARTVVAAPDRPLVVCPFGTPALGTAGAGDVLAGLLGAVVAEAATLETVAAGVGWHALAGEAAAVTDRGLFVSEVADALPGVLARLRAS
ncbi:MAG: NAD(P)H-hydrate dehydratase [Polyangiales bacterium]